ncbi:cobalt ABC transporter permease [Paenibacillus marchantiophytorum]|uniref:Cobalt ABC transporter permease n=1 Tax=Paenibacillus marchantiophytorum TaxID=1619310 RepID=A0ABQ1FEN7_9BACL|nr:ECF transporter S component [Paenibacillus marchantiophytorum]GGA08290.1 cobalt ABC transporter permease [Paenibacillus marchantiophytorum]
MKTKTLAANIPLPSSTRKKRAWKTKDILVAGMIAVVFAFIQIGATYAFMAMTSAVGPVYARLLNGLWFMSGFMALAIIRKPGIGFTSQIIAGLVMSPLTPFGIMMLFGTFVNGLLTELVFLVTRYKRYNTAVMVIGMSVLSLIYTLAEYGSSGYGGLSTPIQIGLMASSVISGGLCGWLCKRLTDSLLKTGLLSGYADAHS